MPITWRYVPCDAGSSIQYHFKDHTNPDWAAIQIRDHRYRIATVEARRAGGDFVSLPREDYNYFVAAQGLGSEPFDLRVTDIHGHVLEDDGLAVTSESTVAGAGQFPTCE